MDITLDLDFSCSALLAINTCWLYLGTTFLSDVTNPSGTHCQTIILPFHYFQCPPSLPSPSQLSLQSLPSNLLIYSDFLSLLATLSSMLKCPFCYPSAMVSSDCDIAQALEQCYISAPPTLASQYQKPPRTTHDSSPAISHRKNFHVTRVYFASSAASK